MTDQNESQTPPTSTGSKIHPLAAAAAVAIIIACGVAVASMTGLLPKSGASTEQSADAAASQAATSDGKSGGKSASHKKSGSAMGSDSSVAPGSQYASNGDQAGDQTASAPACNNCGVVESVNAIQQQGQSSGLGAAAGAVLGGVLGHQVGGGKGKTLATIAGAVGGGLAGNAVEKNRNASTAYQVTVRMDDGSHQHFTVKDPQWRNGDLVQVVNGALQSRN